MTKETTGLGAAVLLIGMLVSVPRMQAAPLGPSVGVRAGAAIELAGSEPFPVKAQAAGGGGLFTELQFSPWYGLGLAAQIHATGPSDLSSGFQYRGHWGADLRLYLTARSLEHAASTDLELVAGHMLGAIARYDGYLLTYRYFFYLGVYAEPYLELHFRAAAGGRHSLTASIPLDLYFRRDLPVSAAVGLALSWKLYFPKPASGGRP